MRYFILSEHSGIGYLTALRILAQDPNDVCTFLVPSSEVETWTTDPLLRPHLAAKSALVVTGDLKNADDVQRAWHVAEMGIDSECSGIEAVIITDVPNQVKTSNISDEVVAVLKCFPAYPYPPPSERFAYSPRSPRGLRLQTTTFPLHMPRSPSYSSRCPRLILVSPSRSLKRLHSASRTSREELAIAWATGKSASANTSTTALTPMTEPGTPIHADSHSIHSSYSNQLTLAKTASLFPENGDQLVGGGWLDPKYTLIVRPAALVRRRCRGDQGSAVPYRIQEESCRGGWSISKRDVAHFIVEKALDEWSAWGGRRVRIAY